MADLENKTILEKDPRSKLLRRLSGNESYQLAMYVLDQYRGTSVSCRYAIPRRLAGSDARAELTRTVEEAITDVVLKHAALQLGIRNADSAKPTWVQLDTIDLREHIEWHFIDGSTDFEHVSQEITQAQLDAPFPHVETRPGWRVVLLQQLGTNVLQILFAWNHPHCDGISGKIIQRHILQSLNSDRVAETARGSQSFVIRLPEATPNLPPPIDHLLPLPLEFKWVLKTIWEENKPRMLCTGPYQADWAPIHTSPYKTQFRAFTLDNSILVNLLNACRAHHTTLTGLLHGLMLISLASRLEERAAPGFRSVTTLDLRRYLPRNPSKYPWLEPEDTVGNYVTQMNHEFNPTLVSQIRSSFISRDAYQSLSAGIVGLIWSASATVREEIVHKLEHGTRNDIVGTMKFVMDWRTQMKQAARRPRPASWMITGLGVLDNGPNTGKSSVNEVWSLQRAQFALSAETTAAALMISPMSVADGCLSVGGSWQDCLFEAKLGEGVIGDLERWLLQLGG